MIIARAEGKAKSHNVLDPVLRKQIEQAQIMNLIKSTGKLKKELAEEPRKTKIEANGMKTQEDTELEKNKKTD